MEMDGHLHSSSPPVTAFAICFRPSRPVPYPILQQRERGSRLSGQRREVARRSQSHMKREGQFLEWPLSVGPGAHLFPMQTSSSSYRARRRDVEERGAKTTFRRYFRSERTKKGVAVAKTASFEVRAAAHGEEERQGNLI